MDMDNSIVEDWLKSLQLPQYSESFIDNGYDDLEICKKIDEPDLDAIGVVNTVHREKILNAVKILLEHGGTAVYFTLEGANNIVNDDNPESPISSAGTTISVSSTETRRTSDSSPLNQPSIDAVSQNYDENIYQESANLVKIPKLQLKMLIRDRLVGEGIKLSSSPYTNPDGSRGFLEGLASRYAEQLKTHYQDVLERLGELWSKMVAYETSKAPVSYAPVVNKSHCSVNDACSANSIYAPGKYSPSSCLSDHDEEAIYGYTKLAPWSPHVFQASSRSFNGSYSRGSPRSHNMYDSDGYYSIGFNHTDTETDSPSIKKKSGIAKFLKVLASKKDKNKSQQRSNYVNSPPLCDKYAVDEERLRIMLLASEGRISVKAAIQTVQMLETERNNALQQQHHHPNNLQVVSGLRRSLERIPANGQVVPDSNHHYYTDSLHNRRSSHFYDDPPYESDESECAKTSEKSRKKYRTRKSHSEKGKCRRANRDKYPPSANVYNNRPMSPDEFKCDMLPRNGAASNKRLLNYASCSSPNTPVHSYHDSAQQIGKLSLSCAPSPIYSLDSKYCDYTSSPISSRRQRFAMFNRIKQLTSRTSLSADEELGYSPSSEYDEREEIEMAKVDSSGASARDAGAANCGRPTTIVGKMKVLRRDVKRKISKLRSSRGSECEADGALSSMVNYDGSSAESLEQETQESILTNQVHTTTTNTASSSSNRSSASTEGDTHLSWSGPIMAQAQALVDCIPSPYDEDALKFKKGQIIDVISMDASGIWKGICGNQIGTFKFINVKLVENTRHRQKRHHRKRYSRKSKPSSVQELLCRINLQQYVSIFMLNGYEKLELFQDIEEEDLDYLGIVEPEHRAKLITAAELLHDYNHSPDADQSSSSRQQDTKPAPAPNATIETSVSFDSAFKYNQTRDHSTCFNSSDNMHSKQSTDLEISDTHGNQPNVHKNNFNASHVNKKKVPPPIPSRANIPANIEQLKPNNQTSPLDTAGIGHTIADAIPQIDHQVWESEASGLFAETDGKQDPLSESLMNQIVHKLNAEGINLTVEPYTDKTGLCGIPPALVQRYTEELDEDMHKIAKILDRIRIIHLKMQGSIGVPNDFLIDSCQSPSVIQTHNTTVFDWLISLGLPMYYECFHQMGFLELNQIAKMTESQLKLCRVKDGRHLNRFSQAIELLRSDLEA